MTPVRVQAGRDLTREGETGREFLIIVDGTATVRRQGRVVATLGTGDFVGELSMLAGVPRTATVTADTDLTVEALNRREFTSLLDQNPRLARKVMVGAIRRLHAVDHGPAD
jgi:CRP-like cAMP-binding protein